MVSAPIGLDRGTQPDRCDRAHVSRPRPTLKSRTLISTNSMTGSASAAPVSTAAATYRVAVADADRDQAAITGLWAAGGLGGERTPDYDARRYDWFYRRNPQAQASLNLLYSNDEPVGFLGLGARSFYVDGSEAVAGVLVDFVVIPKHRSVFPALTLQRQARAIGLGQKPVIYGLPDTKAVPVCRRLDMHVQKDMQRWVRVTGARHYLERKLPAILSVPLSLLTDWTDRLAVRVQVIRCGLLGAWIESFDDRFDDLWSRAEKRGRAIGVRNRQFLSWRFTEQPGHSYRIFAIERTGDQQLIGYFVCEIAAKFLAIKDCLNVGSPEEFTKSLLLLSAAARKLGLTAVSVELTAASRVQQSLRRAQFVQRSHRPFFAVLHESVREAAQKCDWYITSADEDI
jgi:hypothetical protein